MAENGTEHSVQSDPTIANAGLTELDAPEASAMTNGHAASFETPGIPANAGLGDEGNAAAEAKWDPSADLSASQEWVEVPRDAAETDTGVTATPAAPSNVQSWADDASEVSHQTNLPPKLNLSRHVRGDKIKTDYLIEHCCYSTKRRFPGSQAHRS